MRRIYWAGCTNLFADESDLLCLDEKDRKRSLGQDTAVYPSEFRACRSRTRVRPRPHESRRYK